MSAAKQDIPVIPLYPQQLGTWAENLHKNQVSQNNLSLDGEEAHQVPLLAVKLFTSDYCWRREEVFFQDVAHESLPMLHYVFLNPCT